MGVMASQMNSFTIVYSTVYSGADQSKRQSSASLAFVRGIHRSPVNSPHKYPVTRKMFSFDDVTMGISQCAFCCTDVQHVPCDILGYHLVRPFRFVATSVCVCFGVWPFVRDAAVSRCGPHELLTYCSGACPQVQPLHFITHWRFSSNENGGMPWFRDGPISRL